MKAARIIIKIVSFVFFGVRYRSSKFAYLLANNNISPKKCTGIINTKGNIISTATGNALPLSTVISFNIGIIILLDALKEPELKFENPTNKSFIATFNGIKVHVLSVTNLYTLYEIFIRKMYDISLPKNDAVIIDIGMNVGYASLFFAANSNISKVYAFEPFKETHAEAGKNFNLNPQINNKITSYAYGISDSTKTVDVPLLGSGSAVASTNDLFISKNNLGNSNKIHVDVKDIAAVFEEVVLANQNKPIFLKIDCEGEEYVIMEKLNASGHLKNISGFLLEWHIKGAQSIINTLIQNQFTVFNAPIINADASLETEAGMLYAFKQN